jgi:peptide/nickel transport system ATP-binding protein
MSEANDLLTVHQLSIGFGAENESLAVNAVNFSLNKQTVLGVVGESGSGKTLTAQAIIGILPKQATIHSGRVIFHSHQLSTVDLLIQSTGNLRLIRGKEISMIFQEPMTALNPVLTCGRQLTETILAHENLNQKQAKEKALALLEEVLLPHPLQIYKSYPHQLSGGQRQRVLIAIAIACNPLLLLADEPTTALDVTIAAGIIDLLKQLQTNRKMSIIFISHDWAVVKEIADEIIVMYQGRIVESGKTERLVTQPTHPYTQGLLHCRPQTAVRYTRLPVMADFLENQNKKYSIESGEQRKEKHARIYTGKPLIRVTNLSVSYKKVQHWFGNPQLHPVLQNVSFDVFTGETLGLVGESGAGKTTLVRAILKLIPINEGDIYWGDVNINTLTRRQLRPLRKNYQIIFQDSGSALNPILTVAEAMLEPLRFYQIEPTEAQRKARAVWLLEKTGLSAQLLDRFPHQLSGGQRQRVCIARALATEPRFLICDESVSALDVSVQAQVLNLLSDLKTEFKLTYLFISHDLKVVYYFSDRIMVMKQGQIVELAEADQLFSHPQHPYTAQLIESIRKF